MAQLFRCSLLLLVVATLANGFTRERRLAGGVDADISQHPYLVAIKNKQGVLICSGAILSPTKILTAASCLSYLCPSGNCKSLAVHSGFTSVTEAGNVHNIKSVTISKDYDKLKNDIGVITLESEIKFSAKEKPIDLPDKDVVENTIASASGWGLSMDSSKLSESLKNIKENIITNDKCTEMFKGKIQIDDNTFCAVPVDGPEKAGLCAGDGGAPLIHDGKVVGLLSYGIGCADGYPDVFTNVYKHLDFIKQELIN